MVVGKKFVPHVSEAKKRPHQIRIALTVSPIISDAIYKAMFNAFYLHQPQICVLGLITLNLTFLFCAATVSIASFPFFFPKFRKKFKKPCLHTYLL